MEIKRDAYVNTLLQRRENGRIKVITGMRRCGKSYLMHTLFYNSLLKEGVAKDSIVRLAFDVGEDGTVTVTDIDGGKRTELKPGPGEFARCVRSRVREGKNYCLLADGVECLSDYKRELINLLRGGNADIYMTASHTSLLKENGDGFGAECEEIRLQPLAFSEFMQLYPGTPYEGLAEYLMYGGIPQVAMSKTGGEKAKALQTLLKDVCIGDMARRNRLKRPAQLEKLMGILASKVGTLTNAEQLKNSFSADGGKAVTAVTAQSYLNCVEDACLAVSVRRYDIKTKTHIETPKKYYFADPGIGNALTGFRCYEQAYAMENAIFNELLLRGFDVDIGVVPVSRRNGEGKLVRIQMEVDFVCNLGSKRYYVQSAYSLPTAEDREQAARSLRRIDDSFKKVIVTKDIVAPSYDEYGILTVNIYDFLLKRDAMDW